MKKPHSLKTKIFLDSGNPEETKQAIKLLGFLDGQTTNPSLIVKHPSFIACKAREEKCTEESAWGYYKDIVSELSPLVGEGSVSIEVYADHTTKAEEMIRKGEELSRWIPNAHVKLPITNAGLTAAKTLSGKGIRVNMTLCFTQEQAAAVYAATSGAHKGDVFVSPFVGRLDDRGENGMELIKNIKTMYARGDGHVEALVASVRTFDHFMYSLALGVDIITAPFSILNEWGHGGMPLPDKKYVYKNADILKAIPYQTLDLSKDWTTFDIHHELTDKGIEKFAADWNALLA